MPTVKPVRIGTEQPAFPAVFDIKRRVVLQNTSLGKNKNKFYGIEEHHADGRYRVYSHWGRTDHLESKGPSAGRHDGRYVSSASAASVLYDQMVKEKLKKKYVEVDAAASDIGSPQARGTSAGKVDEKTLSKAPAAPAVHKVKPLDIEPEVAELTKALYAASTGALTKDTAVSITAKGLKLPGGTVLSIGQIEKAEACLASIHQVVLKEAGGPKDLEDLSNHFYSLVPHRLGRTTEDLKQAIIDSLLKVSAKGETLQLMKDMLIVDSSGAGAVLFDDDLSKKFAALDCEIRVGKQFEDTEPRVLVTSSCIKRMVKVKTVFVVERPGEEAAFRKDIGNVQVLFHGSRSRNWVGILARGIMMPKLVLAAGGSRTDGGWLGNGIYFGDAACTSYYYTSVHNGHRYIAICDVAMGKVCKTKKRHHGIDSAPKGFDSYHGLRSTHGNHSQFADNEMVVYDEAQQRLRFLLKVEA